MLVLIFMMILSINFESSNCSFQGDLEPTLSKLGEVVSQNGEELGKLVATKEEIFSEGIKEYQLYINTVKNVLKTRDHMQVLMISMEFIECKAGILMAL